MFGWFKKEKKQKKYDDELLKHVNKKLMNNPFNDFLQSRRFLDSGHGHEADGNLNEALICYETSMKLKESPMALYDMAGIYMKLGENSKAKELLQKALAMKCPEDLLLLINKRMAELA